MYGVVLHLVLDHFHKRRLVLKCVLMETIPTYTIVILKRFERIVLMETCFTMHGLLYQMNYNGTHHQKCFY